MFSHKLMNGIQRQAIIRLPVILMICSIVTRQVEVRITVTAIETRHSEITLAVLLPASGQNFLFRSGVPQLDCAIIAPGRQPLPVGRECH
jgi:hypothetical protein